MLKFQERYKKSMIDKSITLEEPKKEIKSKKAKKEKKVKVSTKTGGGVKAFMSKLSGAFLLPISVMAIAGLFLGVGATIAGQWKDFDNVRTLGEFIKSLGEPIFSALPLLFAAALAVSFTEEAGVAVFAAIVGYMTFSAIQTVFITPEPYVLPSGEQRTGYKILWEDAARKPEALGELVGSTLGITSLQTSVFGGIMVGLVVQWAYMRFHTIKLPNVISFFGGKRFVSLAVIVLMIPLALIFLIVWPYVGFGFNWFGQNSGKIPYGFDSFIFGFIERSLVPFGLHHVFYSPLWYTGAGGNVGTSLNEWVKAGNVIANDSLISKDDILNALKGGIAVGDSTTTVALVGVSGNIVKYIPTGSSIAKELPLYEFVANELGIKLGRYLQGKYIFMLWGLPFAGLAMILAAPKENRKAAFGIVFPASLTSFVTGVTEPIEFTFLFLAPLLFFGFHAFMCATAFLLMNLMGAHIGMTFSGGVLDLIIYGIIPMAKGTNFWWSLVFGGAYAPIYFLVFYFWIKKANLATPGRGGNTKLFTKKDYLKKKEGNEVAVVGNANSSLTKEEIQAIKIIEAFGGKENISKTGNCASRLRFDVVDANNVSEEKLKEAGAFGVRKISNIHVQAIFGPKADQIRVSIDKVLNSGILDLDKEVKIVENASIVEENVTPETEVLEQVGILEKHEGIEVPVELDDAAMVELEKAMLSKTQTKYVKHSTPNLAIAPIEYYKFINALGGFANIKKISTIGERILFEVFDPTIVAKENISLPTSNSMSINFKNEVTFTFNSSNVQEAKSIVRKLSKEILSN